MSMHGHLLIKKQGDETLDMFVTAVDKIIGPLEWQDRQSSNYVDEHYFLASVLALQISIALADDSEFSRYEFWLSIAPSVVGATNECFLDGVADVVARALALNGYEVLHPNDLSRQGNGGTIYRLNPDRSAKPRERIVVEYL